MTRRDIRRFSLEKVQRSTLLILMHHRHDTNPDYLGTVPFHLNERGPNIPIRSVGDSNVITFKGQDYEIFGYGVKGKTRAIVGPWPSLGDEINI